MAYRLGVDMGTTFTAAAVANGMSPTLVGLGNRALQIPSVLFLNDDGNFLVGEAAEHRGLAEPERVVREFKRRIGDTVPMLVGGAPYSPQTLTARLLRHVVSAATERMGTAPERLVLTHPANWGPYKLELLDQVATLAGLGRVERIPEPLAAAAHYATRTRVEVGEIIAVYDLGGGTFDACVLRKEPGGFSVLGKPEGIEHLGGVDFDEAVFQHVLGRLGSRLTGLDPDDHDVLRGLARLRRDCVEAKEALSSDTRTLLPVVLPGLTTKVTLERVELEDLIRPALADTMLVLRRTLESAAVEPRGLKAIVLIGGSSRIPLVGELVQRTFEVPIALDTHPKHDVALGAISASAVELDKVASPSSPPSGEPPTQPAPAMPMAPQNGPVARPEVTTDGATGRRPRAVILAIAGAVLVVVVAIVATVAALRSGAGSAGGQPSGLPSAPSGLSTAPSGAPSGPSTPPGPDTAQLPASRALSRYELLVARQLHGTDWELYRANADKTGPGPRLTKRAGVDSAPVLSPDRRTVIYIHIDADDTRTLRVAGAADLSGDRLLFQLPPGCVRPLRPAWSPTDASLLAIGCRDAAGRTTLRLMRTDGSVVDTVAPPSDLPRVDDLAFSADGRRLGFWASSSQEANDGRLYTVAVSGGTPKPIFPVGTVGAGHDADLAFSPDGEHIAFSRRRDAQTDIMVARADGTQLRSLITGPADDQAPTWSPDGRRIAFKSNAPAAAWPGRPTTRIWVTSSTEDDPRLLWTRGSPEQQSTPAWR